MTDYKIEKDIPIPSTKQVGKKYPLVTMDLGDSFVMPLVDRNSLTAATNYLRKSGDNKKFTTRRISETEMRVWRIA
jgi:hypothetical protein